MCVCVFVCIKCMSSKAVSLYMCVCIHTGIHVCIICIQRDFMRGVFTSKHKNLSSINTSHECSNDTHCSINMSQTFCDYTYRRRHTLHTCRDYTYRRRHTLHNATADIILLISLSMRMSSETCEIAPFTVGLYVYIYAYIHTYIRIHICVHTFCSYP